MTVAALGIAVAGPAQAEASKFSSFGATSEAAGIAFKVVYSGFASMFPIVDASVAHISGSLDSRPNARGYSSAVDPGQAIQSLSALGVPVPAYPFNARAEFPGATPRARTSVTEQAIGPGMARMIVSDVVAAEGPRLQSSGIAGSFDAEGVLSTGTVISYTTMDAAGESVSAVTDVVVSDVVIGGALRIGSVHTTVRATAGGTAGSAGGVPHIEFANVTFAGQAATIDEKGVHLAGQALPGVGAGSATDPLKAAGISASLGGVTSTALPDGTAAVARAEGLIAKVQAPDGSVVEFRIGSAVATAGAVPAVVGAPVSLPEEPQYSSVPFEPVVFPTPVQTFVEPPPPGVEVHSVAARPIELPGHLVGAVAAAQLGFWAIVGLLGWWSRPRTQGVGREWFFDSIDRVQAVDHT
ncbi:MAG: hypothetical protein WDA27_10395 [Actinomycetota bacterium]